MRDRGLGPILVTLAAALVLLLVAINWSALNGIFDPQSQSKADAVPIWLVLDGQSALGAYRAHLDRCAATADCSTDSLLSAGRTLLGALTDLEEAVRLADGKSHLAHSLSDQLTAMQTISSGRGADQAGALSAATLSLARQDSEVLASLLVDMVPLARRLNRGSVLLLEANLRTLLLLGSAACMLVGLGYALHQRLSLKHELRAVKQAEAAWRQATLQVFDSLPVPVLVVGHDRVVRYANQAAKDMVTPADGDDIAELARRIRRSVESQTPNASGTFDFPLFGSDGSTRHVTVAVSSFQPLEDKTDTYVIADNTLLRDAELRALTAGKLAVLGELSSAIAHELNQPLAVIKAAAANGRSQAERLPGASRIAEKFTRIDDQIERARRIIENVRRLGRPAQAAVAVFSVAKTLRSTIGLVSQQYKLGNVSLDTEMALDDMVQVKGEGTLFEIAVLNILLNARDAFAGEAATDGAALVKLGAFTADGRVHLTISDNAGGIPAELLPRIFESFVSSKSADAGTGLGLSIARRAIEGMGGTIAAANAEGGAVFSIDLPIFEQESVS